MTAADALPTAVRLARQAGELQLARRDELVVHGTKAHVNDLVSDVDLASEDLLAAGLREAFPDDGVLGEEGTDLPGTSGRRWVLDPIDGTRNYITRSGSWSVCVALREPGEATALAVVHDPVLDETFTAVAGGGAHLNGSPIRASTTSALDRALLALTFNPSPETRDRVGRLLPHLLRAVGDLRRYPAALHLAYLASGRVDVGLLLDTKPWDVMAGHLIAAEAGVVLTGPGGTPTPELTLSSAPALWPQFGRRVLPLLQPGNRG
ncbi:inositol monophosphatase family protein [Actinomadura vinacea]|uniref:Inositol-1-monophosphatase n=1 Tax=Actinomadura vinacea TaxID=115336 RepID=A0ABN3JRB1_9ACTN